MINRILQKLVLKLEQRCIRRGDKVHITGTAGPDDVYLIRYFLLQTKWLSIYIHRFLRSDRDDPHDHPFAFFGYCVKGGYTEVRYTYDCKSFAKHVGYREQGSLAFRKGSDIHAVMLDQEYAYEDRYDAPLTVIFRGPYYRPWGFWKDIQVAPEWVIWYKYLNVENKDTRE